MMNPVRVVFDKPIVQRSKPLNGLLDIIALYADTGAIFRGRLYWFPIIHLRALPTSDGGLIAPVTFHSNALSNASLQKTLDP